MHIALIFDFEIGKKMILKLLDTGNFAPNSFNVFFRTILGQIITRIVFGVFQIH